jgi:hypothetical protein
MSFINEGFRNRSEGAGTEPPSACTTLVVTQSERVANWASRPIAVRQGCSLSPLVFSPSSVPVISLAEAVAP